MKIVIKIVVLLFSSLAFCQDIETGPEYKTVDGAIDWANSVDVSPEFPGGNKELYEFITANYKTPEIKGLIGRVFVQFTVETDGSLTDIKSIRDIGFGTGEEAVRVMSICPKWIPAKRKGETVSVKYTLPIPVSSKI